MKRALIGAVAVAVAAFATPALAQSVIQDPGYIPYTEGGYWGNGNAMALGYATQSAESDGPRYHGGPKVND
jgi:hypothetical protein